jgi:hypothetical protein
MLQKVKDFALKNKKYLLIGAGVIVAVVLYKKYKK